MNFCFFTTDENKQSSSPTSLAFPGCIVASASSFVRRYSSAKYYMMDRVPLQSCFFAVHGIFSDLK